MYWREVGCIIVLSTVALHALPINTSDIGLFLYTLDSPESPVDISKLRSNEDLVIPVKPVKVLFHGWCDNSSASWLYATKDAYMNHKDVNVILVDWGKYAFVDFLESVQYKRSIGDYLGDVFVNLADNYGIPLSDFHLLGHSLGAHIAGFVGKRVFDKTERKLGRITGLDPAGLFYIVKPAKDRLDSTDADFVDVIHTDVVFGNIKELGHADFYPNGGAFQEGCPLFSNCSHCRAPLYFLESIGNTNFTSWKCRSLDQECDKSKSVPMGNECPRSARGNFYLRTNGESPFAQGPN